VKVQAIAFSPTDKYIVTLGGEDDNNIAVWDLQTGKALCGSPASRESAGNALCLAFANNSDEVFVSGGEYTLRVWELDLVNKKIRPTDCQLGQLKRIITCLSIDNGDENIYCGTSTGDVLQVNMNTKLFRNTGPQTPVAKGALSIALAPNMQILLGSGTGTVYVMNRNGLKISRYGSEIKPSTQTLPTSRN
jgi:WD40 repeat protein